MGRDAGVSNSMQELTERMLNIPHALAKKRSRGNEQLYEELVSVGNEALMEAYHSFQPDKGASLTTHLFCRVDLAGRMHVDPTRRTSENRWRRLSALGEMDGNVTDSVEGGGDALEKREWLENTLRKLPPLQKAVYVLSVVEKLPAKEIGRRIGRCTKTVGELRKKAEKKIKYIVRRMGRSYAGHSPKNKNPPRNENQRKASAQSARERAVANRALGNIPVAGECWYMVDDDKNTVTGPCRSIRQLFRLRGLEVPRSQYLSRGKELGVRFTKGREATALLRKGYSLECYLSSNARRKNKILNAEKVHA
jgi:RNA polymerase sigma factor (sigma-70 family)